MDELERQRGYTLEAERKAESNLRLAEDLARSLKGLLHCDHNPPPVGSKRGCNHYARAVAALARAKGAGLL